MAKEKGNQPLKKYTIRLVEGDPERLDKFFPGLGHNAVIRAVVNRLVKRLEEKLNRKLTSQEGIEIGNDIADRIIGDD